MKRHKIRARILEELSRDEYRFNKLPDDEKLGTYYEIEVSVGIQELVKRIGYSEYEIESQIRFLVHQGEVQYVGDGPGIGWYMLTTIGRTAFADDKYVKLAIDEQYGHWSKRVAIWTSIGAFVVSASALSLNWYNSYSNASSVEKVNARMDSLENRIVRSIQGK